MKRVRCLYRVSTVKQLDKNDIPMQRIACREFAEKMGWTVITCAENGEPYSIAKIHEMIVEALPQEFIYA